MKSFMNASSTSELVGLTGPEMQYFLLRCSRKLSRLLRIARRRLRKEQRENQKRIAARAAEKHLFLRENFIRHKQGGFRLIEHELKRTRI